MPYVRGQFNFRESWSRSKGRGRLQALFRKKPKPKPKLEPEVSTSIGQAATSFWPQLEASPDCSATEMLESESL